MMRLLEYIEYSIEPQTKFTICAVLFIAIFVVYFWEPNKKRKNKSKSKGFMQDIDIDASDYQGDPKALVERTISDERVEHHQTLQQLDQYVEVLKRHRIENMDDV